MVRGLAILTLSAIGSIPIQQQAAMGTVSWGSGSLSWPIFFSMGASSFSIRVFFSDACRITHLLRFYGRNLSNPLENDLLAQVQVRNCRCDPLPAPGRQHHVGDVVAGGVVIIVGKSGAKRS